MDFRLRGEDLALRDELEAWLKANLPDGWEDHRFDPDYWETEKAFLRRLGAAGYVAAGWPKEFGGGGMDYVKQAIIKETLAYHHAYTGPSGNEMLPPVLMEYGTPEQQAEHLGAIARGERYIAVWFSEPNAGSDLANVETTAVEDGDSFVVNGTKLWQDPQFDYGVLMARTDRDSTKHRGLSFFVLPKDTPGVTVTPLVDAAGTTRAVAQTVFENARVPKANLIGELNRGWYVTMAMMNTERSIAAVAAWARRLLDDVLGFCRSDARGRTVLADPVLVHRLAQFRIEVEVARLFVWNIACQHRAGIPPDVLSAENKLFSSELLQRMSAAMTNLAGLFGQVMPGSAPAVLGGLLPMQHLMDIPQTLAQGSSEIQRTLIATRGAGLPRD